MKEYLADADVVSEIEAVRTALPSWVISTVELVELAENAERAAVHINPELQIGLENLWLRSPSGSRN